MAKEWRISVQALEKLAVPLVASGVSAEEAVARARRSIEAFGGLTSFTEAEAIAALR